MSKCEQCGEEIDAEKEGKHIEDCMSPQEAFEEYMDIVGEMRDEIVTELYHVEKQYRDIRIYRDAVFSGEEKFSGKKLFLILHPWEDPEYKARIAAELDDDEEDLDE